MFYSLFTIYNILKNNIYYFKKNKHFKVIYIQLAQSFLRITSSIMIFCQFSNWGCQLQLQFSQPFLHQFSKSQCPSSRGVPEDSKTPPTCWIRLISSWWWAQRFSKSMQKWLRKLKLKLATLIWKATEGQKIDFCVQSANFNFNFLSHFCIDFENLWEIDENESAVLIDANCKLNLMEL